jgi:adenosylmethionine-8-amino-7-oxononanoate aminotransferase
MDDAVARFKPAVHRFWKRPAPIITRAEGVYLWDQDGKRYIDGAAGSSVVTNIGHGVQSVVDAMCVQANRFCFAAPHVFSNEPMLDLGQLVAGHAPGAMKNNCRTWFGCTGTDSIDSAVRLARLYYVHTGKTSKYAVITRWRSFHGNNIAVAGLHGHTSRRKYYYPMYVNSPKIAPAYCYRCPYEKTYPGCNLLCARALETEIRQQGQENVAAFLAEPVVGAALGAVAAPPGYFEIIRDICDRYDVKMIVDEVMTGWGRIGHWFGIEEWGVTPDIIATAKGMTSGYTPLSATIAKDEIWQVVEDTGSPFLAGHTLNENPVSCAVAIEVIRYVEKNNLVARSKEMGAYLLKRLGELLEFDIVGDVRGKGMMCGLEFVKDKKTKEPFDPKLKVSGRFQAEALERGLVGFQCSGCVDGVMGDMLLVTPPLVMTREQIDEMIDIMKDSIRAVQAQVLH